MARKSPKVISLFSGCGGLDFGFQKAGYDIVYANDIWSSVKKTYEYNLKHEIIIDDITKVNKTNIPQGEVILAGIPCQPFSNAGKRKSTKDKDGNLFLEVIDVVKNQKKKPKVVVFENVRGFLSSKDENGKPLTDRFSEEMEGLGYITKFELINAANFGVPSNRFRIFIVCYLKSMKKEFFFPKPLGIETPTVGDIISMKLPKDENQEVWDLPPSSKNIVKFIKEGGSWKDVPYDELAPRHQRIRDNMKKYKSPNFYRRFSRKEIMGTITATSSPENSGILHPLEDRRYSVREIARFQSYPDTFKFVDASIQNKYKMIGNSVPPMLSMHIAKSILTSLF